MSGVASGMGAARSRLVAGCLYVGSFVLVVCLLFPTKLLIIPRPLYDVAGLMILISLSALVGVVGCLLSAKPRRMLGLFFGLVVAADLMFAAGSALIQITIYHVAPLFGRATLIAVLMAGAGCVLAWVLGRSGKHTENVT